jgi:hypothetical protein
LVRRCSSTMMAARASVAMPAASRPRSRVGGLRFPPRGLTPPRGIDTARVRRSRLLNLLCTSIFKRCDPAHVVIVVGLCHRRHGRIAGCLDRVAETTVIHRLAAARPATAAGIVGCGAAGRNIHVTNTNAKMWWAPTTEVTYVSRYRRAPPLALSVPRNDQNRMHVRPSRKILSTNAVRSAQTASRICART